MGVRNISSNANNDIIPPQVKPEDDTDDPMTHSVAGLNGQRAVSGSYFVERYLHFESVSLRSFTLPGIIRAKTVKDCRTVL